MWVCHVEGCSFSPGHEPLTSPNLGPPISGLLVSLACGFPHCLGFSNGSVRGSFLVAYASLFQGGFWQGGPWEVGKTYGLESPVSFDLSFPGWW